MPAAETRFRAMGSDVHLVVVGGPPSLPEVARDLVEELERRWSRFQPTSEISRLNQLAGHPVRVSTETLTLVRLALAGARVTGGRYDPTVLGAVQRAGYDRSFELLAAGTPADGSSTLGLGHQRVAVDQAGSSVTLPPGVGFDPGGIGKGYAADLLVGELLARGAAGACANLGGDLRVEGEAPGGGAWVVAIGHPLRESPAATIGLRSGAVATSSRVRRAWGQGEDRHHHLIDPATGVPARSGLAAVTVVAAAGWQAEVMAKAAFVAGLGEGVRLAEATGTAALLVDDDGAVHQSAGFHRFSARPRPAGAGVPLEFCR
jgi:thiamine biosynthesis lipoprotein